MRTRAPVSPVSPMAAGFESRRGLDRRCFLAAFAGAAYGAVADIGLGSASAHAAAARTFAHGEFEITIVSDGHLTLPAEGLARNADPAKLAVALGLADLTPQVSAPTNVTLIKTKSELILIDVGAGPNFMPTAGKLVDNLEALGIDRKRVTRIVFTHGHPDHLWGAMDEFEDAPTFPNASYMISADEWNLWVSDDVLNKIPSDRQNLAPGAKRNLLGIKGRVQTIKAGDDIVAGIRTIDTRGHTQGHISLEVAGGRDTLIVLGDALTHPVVSFAYPDWKPAADHEPDRGVATRRKLLDRLASDRSLVIGYHLPQSGLGRVERKGGAYAFVPAT